jgi:hypothetical protein
MPVVCCVQSVHGYPIRKVTGTRRRETVDTNAIQPATATFYTEVIKSECRLCGSGLANCAGEVVKKNSSRGKVKLTEAFRLSVDANVPDCGVLTPFVAL